MSSILKLIPMLVMMLMRTTTYDEISRWVDFLLILIAKVQLVTLPAHRHDMKRSLSVMRIEGNCENEGGPSAAWIWEHKVDEQNIEASTSSEDARDVLDFWLI